MSALSEIQNGDLRRALGSSCKNKVGLAINAAGAATIKSANAISFSIDGTLLSAVALAAQSIAVTHDYFGNAISGASAPAYVQPAGTTVYYVVAINAAGAIAVVQGNYAGQSITMPSDLSRVFVGNGVLPKEPTGYTAIGILKVVTSGAATFNPGTTLLDAANVAVTYIDVERLPSVAP